MPKTYQSFPRKSLPSQSSNKQPMIIPNDNQKSSKFSQAFRPKKKQIKDKKIKNLEETKECNLKQETNFVINLSEQSNLQITLSNEFSVLKFIYHTVQQDKPDPLKQSLELTSNPKEKVCQISRQLKKFEIVITPMEKTEVDEPENEQKEIKIPEEIMYTFSCDKSLTNISPIQPKFAIIIEKQHFDNQPSQKNYDQKSSFSSTVFTKSQINQMGPNLNYSYDEVYEELLQAIPNKTNTKKISFKIQQEPQQTEELKQMILKEQRQKQKLESAKQKPSLVININFEKALEQMKIEMRGTG